MGANKRVPELRFKGFSGEWEEKKLEEIVDLCSGRDYKHLLDGNIPVYGTGGYMLSVNEALSYDKNAIGIGRKGTINKPYVLKAPFWTVDTLFYAIPKKQNYLSFVYNIFQKINWKQKDESTGVPSLSKVSINSIEIFSSKFDEQTKIGNYFQNLDKLIEQKEKKHQKLGQLKKAMLGKMFPKEGATNPEIRFKGFSGEWEEKKLGEIAIFTKGKGIAKADITNDGKILCVRYGELYTKYNEVISIIYSKTNSDINMVYSEENDILMPTSDVTPTGLATASALSQSGIILGGDILIIRNHEIINRFFSYFVKGHKAKIIKLVSGTTVFHLYAKDIENLYLYLPKKVEQIYIANYFQKLDHLIDLQNQELQKLKNIKKASLAKMFV